MVIDILKMQALLTAGEAAAGSFSILKGSG